MNEKRAAIIGCEGQDGRLLYQRLDARGYQVAGLDRGRVRCNFPAQLAEVDILDFEQVRAFIAGFAPAEVYYLAAYHHSSQEKLPTFNRLIAASMDVNLLGLANFLEGIWQAAPATRLFYAASSHIFKGSGSSVQDESTPVTPACAYGISKAAGLFSCRMYREHHGVFASVGILYNHESSYRTENFVSRKIVTSAVNIKHGTQQGLVLGDLSAVVDWGYAPDYVEAMHRLLLAEKPGEYIVATGKPHTVGDFVRIAFGCVGLESGKYVTESAHNISRTQPRLVGNPARIRQDTGWYAATEFEQMIQTMVQEELAMQNREVA